MGKLADSLTYIASAVRSAKGLSDPLTLSDLANNFATYDTAEDCSKMVAKTLTVAHIPYGTEKIAPYAFYKCYELTQANIPGSVKEIGECAFCDCTNLGKIHISDGVVSIGVSAFEGNRDASSVILPKSIKSIADDAFYGCRQLTTIYCAFSEGDVEGAPWGASSAAVKYDFKGDVAEETPETEGEADVTE